MNSHKGYHSEPKTPKQIQAIFAARVAAAIERDERRQPAR